MKFSRLQEDPESVPEEQRSMTEGEEATRNGLNNLQSEASVRLQGGGGNNSTLPPSKGGPSFVDRFLSSNKITKLGLVCVMLLAFVAIMMINTRITSYDNFMQVSNHLNETSWKQESLRKEIQSVGSSLNTIRQSILELKLNTSSSRLQEQLRPQLDRLENTLNNLIRNNTQKLATSERKISDDQKSFESKIQSVLRNSTALISELSQRIGEVTNTTRDRSIASIGRHNSLTEDIMDIRHLMMNVERQVADLSFEQMMLKADTQKEIKIMEATLNLTVQEIAGAKSDHKEFSSHAMGLLQQLLGLAKNETDKDSEADEGDSTVDDITAQQETTPGSSGTSPPPDTCDKPKAVPINMISCTASSFHSSPYKCEGAIDGILRTNSLGSAWASKGEGVGAWIKLQFTQSIEIKVIKLLQRFVELEANREVKLTFDGGISESATLPAKGSRHWNVIKLSRGVRTTSLKITITKVYGTINNGFKEIAISGCF